LLHKTLFFSCCCVVFSTGKAFQSNLLERNPHFVQTPNVKCPFKTPTLVPFPFLSWLRCAAFIRSMAGRLTDWLTVGFCGWDSHMCPVSYRSVHPLSLYTHMAQMWERKGRKDCKEKRVSVALVWVGSEEAARGGDRRRRQRRRQRRRRQLRQPWARGHNPNANRGHGCFSANFTLWTLFKFVELNWGFHNFIFNIFSHKMPKNLTNAKKKSRIPLISFSIDHFPAWSVWFFIQHKSKYSCAWMYIKWRYPRILWRNKNISQS